MYFIIFASYDLYSIIFFYFYSLIKKYNYRIRLQYFELILINVEVYHHVVFSNDFSSSNEVDLYVEKNFLTFLYARGSSFKKKRNIFLLKTRISRN